MLGRISQFSAGRRTKWVVIALWLLIVAAVGSYSGKLQDVTTDENEDYLPASSDSVEVINLLEERFPEGREIDALVVYQREGGLTAQDKQRIAADAKAICASEEIRNRQIVVDPFAGPVCVDPELEKRAQAQGQITAEPDAGPPPVSQDGTAALLLVKTGQTVSEDIQD